MRATSSPPAAGVEGAGRVVEHDPLGTQLAQPAGGLDEVCATVRRARVHEPGIERGARIAHRCGRNLQIVDVVERVVQAHDVDARLDGAQDEAAHEIVIRRPRADQEAPAQGHHQRGVAHPHLECPDALPGALDARIHGRGEHAAASHLEARVADLVEFGREPQDARSGERGRERRLRQQADRRVDESGHVRIRQLRRAGCSGRRACRP